jgi:hypothetical protein
MPISNGPQQKYFNAYVLLKMSLNTLKHALFFPKNKTDSKHRTQGRLESSGRSAG